MKNDFKIIMKRGDAEAPIYETNQALKALFFQIAMLTSSSDAPRNVEDAQEITEIGYNMCNHNSLLIPVSMLATFLCALNKNNIQKFKAMSVEAQTNLFKKFLMTDLVEQLAQEVIEHKEKEEMSKC